ncbi:hypothetical protein, partial [Sinorhizobium meliloti]|uniref:hypothetical protein n=2 Tax=Rhizobium meliloti TaxID=382 RepID=UPI001AECD20F
RDESSAASAAREAFFQPKDLVWLDPCDEHRDEDFRSGRLKIMKVIDSVTLRRGCSGKPHTLCVAAADRASAEILSNLFWLLLRMRLKASGKLNIKPLTWDAAGSGCVAAP